MSIFALLCRTPLIPLIKNFELIIKIISERIACDIEKATKSCKNSGTHQPHIIYPMEIYISGNKRTTESTRRIIILFIFSFSSVGKISSPVLIFALYPAFCTALRICLLSAFPDTVIVFVSRFTLHSSTPSTEDTAF